MDLPQEVVDSYVVDCISRCRAVEERSAAIASSEFPSPHPRQFSRLIGRIAAALVNELQKSRPRYATDPENVLNIIRFIDDFVQELGADLRYADGAVTAKLPWSLSRPFEEMMTRYLPGASFMLRSQWRHNYSIIIDDFAGLYRRELASLIGEPELSHIFRGFPKRFHILSFPSIERKNALLHCDLAHEVGHLVAELFLESEKTEYLITFRERIAERTREENKAAPLAPLWEQQVITERLDLVSLIRRRGLEELISDIFAIRALGLAALLALVSIAAGQSMDLAPDEKSAFYPPWRTRLRFALQALEDGHLTPPVPPDVKFPAMATIHAELNESLRRVREIVTIDSDRRAIDENWLVRLAYDSVNATMPAVHEFLDRDYGKSFPSRDQLYDDAYRLVPRLWEGVPPNEFGDASHTRPATLESILNAAWFYRVAFLQASATPSDGVVRPDLRVLNRLTLKGAELAHLQSRYTDWLEAQP